MQKFKRILLIIVVVIFVLGLGGGSFALFADYSDGYRVGTVIKMSKKGVFFKTYEGQLNLGGFAKDEQGDLTPAIWDFSVYRGDEQVQEAINSAVVGGYKVKLYYEEKYFQFDWRGDTQYFVTKVERVKD